MSRGARILRMLVVCAAAAAAAAALGDQGFWICVPAALLLAAAEPTARAGAVAALVAPLAAAAASPPAPLPAAVAVPLAILVFVALRVRLERERDAMRTFALHDPLTGLFNRRALDGRIEHEMARHRRHRQPLAVMVLDLDGFKAVNDRFGHDAGDDVLRDVARALTAAVREQDTVARLGGDEFCVLAPETDRTGAARLTDRVRTALAGVTTGLSGVSASVGTAQFPADADQPARLLAVADAAALDAKRRRGAGRERRAA